MSKNRLQLAKNTYAYGILWIVTNNGGRAVAKRSSAPSATKRLDGVRRSKPVTQAAPKPKPKPTPKPKAVPKVIEPSIAPQKPELYTASEINSNEGMVTMNVQALRPKRHKWLRHALVVILISALVLVIWLAYSSAAHKAL